MSRRPSPALMTALLVLAWGCAFTATHWPAPSSGGGAMPFPHADKLVHAAIYALLAIAALATSAAWRISWSVKLGLAVWGALAALGALDEATQLLVPGRSADVLDWVADGLGALLGIGLYAAGRSWISSPRQHAPTETAAAQEIR